MSMLASMRVWVWLLAAASVFGSAGLAVAEPRLDAAYDAERARLQAGEAATREEIKRARQQGLRARRRLEAEIRRAETQLLAAEAERGRLESAALQGEDHALLQGDHEAMLVSLLQAAKARLAGEGFPADFDPLQPETSFLAAIEAELHALKAKSGLWIRAGHFYDEHGVEQQGELIGLGGVAVWGLSPKTGGRLSESPSGFRLIAPERELAEALKAGKAPALVPIFLATPGGHQTRLHEQSVFDLANRGGLVAWVILALAGVGLLLLLERLVTLSLAQSRLPGGEARLESLLSQGNFEAAEALLPKMGVVGKALEPVLRHRDLPAEAIEQRVTASVLRVMPQLERSLTLLGVITAIAPLLGLLGTVTGMIATFQVITDFGTGDPKLLSGGISEALITTEFGLAVAVPMLLLRSLMARWSDRLVDAMQSTALFAIHLVQDYQAAKHDR